jgi:hypothetical protein
MRLPFWELSLLSQEPGQPAMIESIVCFGDSATMRKYVHEKRARCPSILLRVKYRMAMTVVRKNSTTVKQHSPGG